MYNPIVSVIVPIFNTEDYLRQCLDSILAQTMREIEIICVNDGSTDRCRDIIKEYLFKDNRIKIIDKKNEGANSARKAGLNMALGQYISFVDSDDWVEPDMYECLMEKANIYDADMVSCSYYVDSEYSRSIVCATEEEKVVRSTEERRKLYKGVLATGFDWVNARSITPSVCNKIFKKKLLSRIFEKADERIIWDEDALTVLATTLNSKCIVFTPEVLYHYRNNALSISHKTNKLVLQNYLYVFDEIDRINNEYDRILDDQIPYYSMTAARTSLEVGFGVKSSRKYIFPFDKIDKGKKIIIYGAGSVGRCYYNEVSQLSYSEKVYLTDSDPEKWSEKVISPDEAFEKDYDIVLIAVESEITAEKIRKDLLNRGVVEDSIVWNVPMIENGAFLFWCEN